jgi:hypothetical protein
MTETKHKIIDEILKNFPYDTHFENDKFIYWIRESYIYNGDVLTREEFKAVQKYVVTHGTVPATKVVVKENEETKWVKTDSDQTYGYNYQNILRYSKVYDSLEMYDFNTTIKSPHTNSTNRIFVLSKKIKKLSVNTKNYVLFNGNRWLSLKNWCGFYNGNYFKKPVVQLLMKTMLGGKDWVMNLDPEKASLLLTNKNSRQANSLEEAISLECGANPAKMLSKFFKIHETIGLYKLIDPNKIHDITNMLKRNSIQFEKLLDDCYEDKHRLVLFYYFLSKDNRCDRHIVMDYLRMLQEVGEKVNLNISSYKTLKRNHDTLSRKILLKSQKSTKKKRLRVSKVYPEIKSLPEMKVEQIRSAKRLDQESEILHHCVHGYDHRINRGECCIYSVVHNDQRYTLQLNAEKVYDETEITGVKIPRKDEEGEQVYELKIAQLKGRFNCDAPESIRKSLQLMCENHDIIPFEKTRINLRENVYENKEHKVVENRAAANQQQVQRVAAPVREVKQIGEKILDQLSKNITISTRVEEEIDEDLPF